MLYVLVYKMGELKYYVQNYRGQYQLNGLVNNAIKFYSEKRALSAKFEIETKMWQPLEVLPVDIKN